MSNLLFNMHGMNTK